MENEGLISKLRSCLSSMENVLFAILYGSAARRELVAESDIDIAIYTSNEMTIDDRIDLIYRLARCLGVTEDKIDLVILSNSTPLELRYKMLRDGILIFARDMELYRRYRDESISMYLDLRVALKAVRYGEIYINKMRAELGGTER